MPNSGILTKLMLKHCHARVNEVCGERTRLSTMSLGTANAATILGGQRARCVGIFAPPRSTGAPGHAGRTVRHPSPPARPRPRQSRLPPARDHRPAQYPAHRPAHGPDPDRPPRPAGQYSRRGRGHLSLLRPADPCRAQLEGARAPHARAASCEQSNVARFFRHQCWEI